MRDALILGFLFFLLCAAMARPFLMSLSYIYVDLVSPQRISYYLLSSIPFSMIMAVLAVLFWLLFDEKKGTRFGALQILMTVWILWITVTTLIAKVPDLAWVDWSSSWKSIAFGIFLPVVLRTRQRIEMALFFVILCVGVITITGGIKTLAGGGGYGTLNLLVESNSGLYEGSTISAVAVALIPIVLYLYRHTTLFVRDWMLKLAAAGLIFSSLLIPIGTEARTGLICIAVLGFMLFLKSKRKLLTLAIIGVIAVSSVPFLPDSFLNRMSTIKTHDEDKSASTRVAVWKWTLDFVKSNPLGGGFHDYVLSSVTYEMPTPDGRTRTVVEKARAFHSTWFEMLGEHGYPGLLLYLSLLITALAQMRGLGQRYRAAGPQDAWIGDLATALFQTLIIFAVGSSFVGIGFQTTLYILLALVASLVQTVAVRTDAARDELAVAAKAERTRTMRHAAIGGRIA